MRILKATFLAIISSYFVIFPAMSSGFTATDDTLQFSGFARVVFGYLDESSATYSGYSDDISLSQQSLIGLQVDYQLADHLSITSQLLGHSGNERGSGVEWLYLTYQPTRSIQIKLGKQRTPFFNYSDSIDVGFAYPWVTLPKQVYNSSLISTFNGVLANYQWSGKTFGFDIEAYWGSFDDMTFISAVAIPANVNDLRGLITKLHYENWIIRASYHTADIFIKLPKLEEFSSVLNRFGFTQSAQSLSLDGKIEFYQLAASYENINYFFRTEMTKTHPRSSTIPDVSRFYVAAGYYYDSFLSYISFAKDKSTNGAPVNEIPIGFGPQLDALALGYQRIFDTLIVSNSQSITVGTKWNFKSNLALKAEVTWIEADQGGDTSFYVLDETKFDKKAPLYQLALEWVF
jgi:hypothetical protein